MVSRRLIKVGLAVGFTGAVVAALNYNSVEVSSVGAMRFGRAAYTAGRIAVDYKISLKEFRDNSPESLAKWSEVHKRSAERLLKLCSDNGGVFIKVGQHIGALDYLVPHEYVSTLKVLHSKAPESSLDDVKKVIKADLNQDVEQLFDSFDEKPIGIASLAQVHKAKLKNGDVVAVKVQHPKVNVHSMIDMASMDILVRLVSKVLPEFSFLWLADEMKINLPLELDFIQEGRNCERVSRMLESFKWFKVPKIYWETSTRRVLMMEYLEGGEVTDREYMEKNGINVKEISRRLGALYSEMIFVHGYVHCDPHPGNILVKNSRNGPEIILLDHGLYTTLTDKFRNQYSNMWLSIINADLEGIRKFGEELGTGDLYPLLACILTAKPWKSLAAGVTSTSKIDKNAEKEELKKYAVEFFPQIAAVLSRVPREMLLLLKTNDLLRGIETSLGTKGMKNSLLTMSKCCVNAVHREKIKNCDSIWCRLSLNVKQQWTLTKISLYQFYIWCCVVIMGSQYS